MEKHVAHYLKSLHKITSIHLYALILERKPVQFVGIFADVMNFVVCVCTYVFSKWNLERSLENAMHIRDFDPKLRESFSIDNPEKDLVLYFYFYSSLEDQICENIKP